MLRSRRMKRLAWLATGVVIGLAVGIALAVGVGIGMRQSQSHGDALAGLSLEEIKLQAFSAHGSDTFAIATGPVDGNADAVFCLDFLTGDLVGFVPSPRTGKFFVAFVTNVLKDLPVEQGKTTKYAMALGRINVVGTSSNIKAGGSIVYVADCNTGKVASYSFPWNDSLAKNVNTKLPPQPMITLEVVEARNVKIRD